jgi:hypothetical protein
MKLDEKENSFKPMRSAGLIENYIEQPNKLSFKSLKPDA